MIYDKFDALLSLKPNGEYIWVGNDYKDIQGDDIPTEAELDAEVERLNNGYQEKRRLEYPSVVDQLDLIYHSGIDVWKAKIKETKDKYPKPS